MGCKCHQLNMWHCHPHITCDKTSTTYTITSTSTLIWYICSAWVASATSITCLNMWHCHWKLNSDDFPFFLILCSSSRTRVRALFKFGQLDSARPNCRKFDFRPKTFNFRKSKKNSRTKTKVFLDSMGHILFRTVEQT